jgi:hypothetical protein
LFEGGGGLVLYGDVNNDGVVDYFDVIALRHYLDGNPPVIMNRLAADVNRDDSLNVLDLTLLRLYVAGHITLPQGNPRPPMSSPSRP